MTNIELYINNGLCDMQSPEEIGIRLNRILINPAELSTKDAQFSYSVSLPNTPTNNKLFGYSNVEEVKNKFNTDYKASLIVDGIAIFNGKFRMTEISEMSYKGNLIVPVQKTVKDIFGDKKMNQLKEWKYDLKKNKKGDIKNFAEIINDANSDTTISDCIFPYILYGIPPRVLDKNGKYTPQEQIDDTVRFGIQDFSPSINCLSAIRQIFRSEGYKIGGNIFNDPRFENLYMSYKNPVDYAQEWHWGHLSKMRIEGSWQNYAPEYIDGTNTERRDKVNVFERFFNRNKQGRSTFVANLLHSNMTKITHISDEGTNIIYNKEKEDNPYPYNEKDKKLETTNVNITIPISGYYKITLSTKLRINCEKNHSRWSKGYKLISGNYNNSANRISDRAYEIKLLRDFGQGDFKLETIGLDGSFYEPNLSQKEFKGPNYKNGELTNGEDFPQYYPVPGTRSVLFVDPAQNERLLSGFRFGELGGTSSNPYQKKTGAAERKERCRILAIKNGWSNNVQFSQTTKIFSAVNNQTQIPEELEDKTVGIKEDTYYGYVQYGRKPPKENDETETETEEPSEEDKIDWYPSNKYKVEMGDAPQNNVYNDNYGWQTALDLNPQLGNSEIKRGDDEWFGGAGKLHQIIWLEKGERITLVSASEVGISKEHSSSQEGWTIQKIDFELEIEACKNNMEWLSMNNDNSSSKAIIWNDPSTKYDFRKDNIDLTKFLPSEDKIDDWLNSFCNTFNLQLTQDNTIPENFNLNVKQTLEQTVYSVIDLSDKVNIIQRSNHPLGLPAVLELGFKVNKAEEGYIKSNKDDGSGKLLTGVLEGQTIKPNSSFSYNWYKEIRKMKTVEEETINEKGEKTKTTKREKEFAMSLPVISHQEVWKSEEGSQMVASEYATLMSKLYTNYAQRFWYRKKNNGKCSLYNLGKIWQPKGINTIKEEDNTELQKKENTDVQIPQLSNEYNGVFKHLTLNYKDNSNSILHSYFSLISSNNSNYTEVECYLSPDEYVQMNGSCLAKLNSDLYYVAAIDRYDPSCRNKTKLKLIRKV